LLLVTNKRYRYPLGVQLTLPAKYSENREFLGILELLQRHGVSELELNMKEPGSVDPEMLKTFLSGFGLTMICFASGLTAKTERLSLSQPDDEERRRAVRRTLELLEYSACFPAGLIIGFLKGPADHDRSIAARQLAVSLKEIAHKAEMQSVAVLLEATNRYESATANTLAEATALVAPFQSEWMQILPDTFHMNIEERDMFGALREHASNYRSVHFSDNNRLLPGLGAIDFGKVISHLDYIGYQGRLALEGNVREDLVADLDASLTYLGKLL
jgi:sugar phosphate isomerase/epimerase